MARFTCAEKPNETGLSQLARRLPFVLLWRNSLSYPPVRRSTFPPAVILNRFEMAFFVFNMVADNQRITGDVVKKFPWKNF
jgi:hypothetical protein